MPTYQLRARVLSGFAAVVAVLAFTAALNAAQEPRSTTARVLEDTRASNIRDDAKLFSPSAVTAAITKLRDLESKTRVATMIVTIESVNDRPIEELAPEMARQSGIEGVFILISKKERKIQDLVSHRLVSETMKRGREAIREAFIAGFRNGGFDEGLKLGVAAIDETLLRAQRAGDLTGRPASSPDGALTSFGLPAQPAGPLVLRNQVRLTLSGARVVLAAAQEKASALKLNVNIAVVDDGGHLIAFERMDGARPASGYTAITKATSAATFRQSSGPLPVGAPLPDPLLNLSLQMAAAASGGKITSLYGGVPIVVDGQVIGAVGVGGGTGEQDKQIGTAGVAALLERLNRETSQPAK